MSSIIKIRAALAFPSLSAWVDFFKKTCLDNLIKKRQDLTVFFSFYVRGNSVYDARFYICLHA